MNSANLLSRIGNYVASNMAQSVYAMSSFSQTANSTTNVTENKPNKIVTKGIVCGFSACGKNDDMRDEYCK